MFSDSNDYKTRQKTPYSPPNISIPELHAAVPKHLFRKSTVWGLYYTARDVVFLSVGFLLGSRIDCHCQRLVDSLNPHPLLAFAIRWITWAIYWNCQGVFMAGLWTLAHEAGHGTLSDHNWINHLIGLASHSFLLVPYFAWRSTHHTHHKKTASLEHDENYIPTTRAQLKLPSPEKARLADYHEVFEESPLYSLLKLVVMQTVGLQAYLLANKKGSPKYPRGTNHFSPFSPLFRPHERSGILASDLGVACMAFFLYKFGNQVGIGGVLRLYFIPYLIANHWIVAITYLQHTDPTVPHFRNGEWSFARGALATVDRPVLGWVGRYFLKNLSHDHIAHHFFSSIPFYNQPAVTECLKPVLGTHYNYDSTNTVSALYRNFTECRFIEDDGDIVFFKNKDGVATRLLECES